VHFECIWGAFGVHFGCIFERVGVAQGWGWGIFVSSCAPNSDPIHPASQLPTNPPTHNATPPQPQHNQPQPPAPGLAIYNAHILEFQFPVVLYKKLMGGALGLEDLGELHPEVRDLGCVMIWVL